MSTRTTKSTVTKRSPGRPQRYPWSRWEDGAVHVAGPADYAPRTAEEFRMILHSHAAKRALKVQTSVYANGRHVEFRFLSPSAPAPKPADDLLGVSEALNRLVGQLQADAAKGSLSLDAVAQAAMTVDAVTQAVTRIVAVVHALDSDSEALKLSHPDADTPTAS